MPGHSYKGRRTPPNITFGLLAPALFIGPAGRIGIVWNNANPPFWNEQSLVAGQWVPGVTSVGTNRSINFAPAHGTVVSVIGRDAAGNNVTARSPSVVF
jgi:hypothetical protein